MTSLSEKGSVVSLLRLASQLFEVPVVLISLCNNKSEGYTQHFVFGTDESCIEDLFLAPPFLQEDSTIILDTQNDTRFNDIQKFNILPPVRFYAAKNIVTATGEVIGTVYLIDWHPHSCFTDDNCAAFEHFVKMIVQNIDMINCEDILIVGSSKCGNITNASFEAFFCMNHEGEVIVWSRSSENLFGYTSESILNKNCKVIFPDHFNLIHDALLDIFNSSCQNINYHQSLKLKGLKNGGAEVMLHLTFSGECSKTSDLFCCFVREEPENCTNNEHLFRLASSDFITGLPNRRLWENRIAQVMSEGHPVALVLINIHSFKEINTAFGYAVGDKVLREIALRLLSAFPENIIISRLDGNEFLILLDNIGDRLVQDITEQLINIFSVPFNCSGHSVEIIFNAGISLAPEHAINPDSLLSTAHLALHHAESVRNGHCELYTTKLYEATQARNALEKELKRAFENHEFELFYQPQFMTHNGMLSGAEALIRWNHPQHGLLTPASFIDVLAKKPSAPAIGEWILRTACEQAAVWRRKIPHFRIGVNLFECQFNSNNFLNVLKNILAESSLPGEALELEIVEKIYLRDDEETLRLLKDIREIGVGLAFDDYGTGYASLSLLKKLPVTRLKIDQSFINDVHIDFGNKAVVKAILSLAHSFGVGVIAEGVETTHQFNFLKKINCPEIQGYLTGKPVPSSEFEKNYIEK